MKGLNECLYKGRTHVHTVNFNIKSCTCRWFLAFAVCAHLISAYDFYNRELKGYKTTKSFVYKKKRGRKTKALNFIEQAFMSYPMPVIPLTLDTELRESIFVPGHAIALPEISNPSTELEAPIRITRYLKKKKKMWSKQG